MNAKYPIVLFLNINFWSNVESLYKICRIKTIENLPISNKTLGNANIFSENIGLPYSKVRLLLFLWKLVVLLRCISPTIDLSLG